MNDRRFVKLVEQRLDKALASNDGSQLVEATRQLCLAGDAKRIRPRLALMAGRAVGADPHDLVDVGVAGELIHSGSLLHDDVIDEGLLRRGRPTANARWGNLTAVLAGDLCLTLAFVQLERHPRALTTEAVQTIATMTRAAMAEAEARGRLNLDEVAWRDFVEGKTGALFAWCTRSAARLAGAEEAVSRFGSFGLHLGVAFQLADDLLDLVGGAHKDRFSDLKNREPSYPVWRAAWESRSLRREIERLWAGDGDVSPEQAETLGLAILEGPAWSRTVELIGIEVEAAIEALGPWADTPSGLELARLARTLESRAQGDRACRAG